MAHRHGVIELSAGLFAYVQPSGSWGLANTGLVTHGGRALLVDTLYDLARTRSMLDEYARVAPCARRIDTVVNTHANGDHCWGNGALAGAEIIASRRSADEMAELPPAQLALLVAVSRATMKLGRPARSLLKGLGRLGLSELSAVGRAAPFVLHAFSAFDFRGLGLTPPTRTFDDALSLELDGRKVELVEVGPAHTQGDVFVHVPDAGVVFTGDILFSEAHPIVWAGPFSHWISACERIEALSPEVVVPGHGRLSSVRDVADTRSYLAYVYDQAKQRHAAGMSAHDAARDIALGAFSHWSEAERIVVNVAMAFREFERESVRPKVAELFAAMGEYWEEREGKIST